jgi:hypothetical protein
LNAIVFLVYSKLGFTSFTEMSGTDFAKIVGDVAQMRALEASSRAGVREDGEESDFAKARWKIGIHILSGRTTCGRRSGHVALDESSTFTELRISHGISTWIFRWFFVLGWDTCSASIIRMVIRQSRGARVAKIIGDVAHERTLQGSNRAGVWKN